MITFIIVSIVGGILFGAMDGLLNANPLAQRLYQVYAPIARSSVNAGVGIAVDLAYGFILAGIFVLLYESLPGGTGWMKGLSFAALAWFFRVLMGAASQWIMFKMPGETILYVLVAGLLEMLAIGLLYGLTLRPTV
jgi:hypothetical protein